MSCGRVSSPLWDSMGKHWKWNLRNCTNHWFSHSILADWAPLHWAAMPVKHTTSSTMLLPSQCTRRQGHAMKYDMWNMTWSKLRTWEFLRNNHRHNPPEKCLGRFQKAWPQLWGCFGVSQRSIIQREAGTAPGWATETRIRATSMRTQLVHYI